MKIPFKTRFGVFDLSIYKMFTIEKSLHEPPKFWVIADYKMSSQRSLDNFQSEKEAVTLIDKIHEEIKRFHHHLQHSNVNSFNRAECFTPLQQAYTEKNDDMESINNDSWYDEAIINESWLDNRATGNKSANHACEGYLNCGTEADLNRSTGYYWRLVDEKPIDDQNILVKNDKFEGSAPIKAYYDEENEEFISLETNGSLQTLSITHWMPMPK